MPPTLRRSPGASRLVSRGGREDVPEFRTMNAGSGGRHTSRGREDRFCGFLNYNLHFRAHRMSHPLGVEVPHGLHPHDLLGRGGSRRQPTPAPRRDDLFEVLLPPARAGAPIPLALARSDVADRMSLPSARIALEPASADRAGSLCHSLLRREGPRDAGRQLMSGVDHFWRAGEGQICTAEKPAAGASGSTPTPSTLSTTTPRPSTGRARRPTSRCSWASSTRTAAPSSTGPFGRAASPGRVLVPGPPLSFRRV